MIGKHETHEEEPREQRRVDQSGQAAMFEGAQPVCVVCGCPLTKKQASNKQDFCSHACRAKVPRSPETIAKISAAGRGKPKPSLRGERNPNFGNKSQGTPEATVRLREASKRRGLAWSAEERARHAQRMRGPSNKMRGRIHTPQARERMSDGQRAAYSEGRVKVSWSKVSAGERRLVEDLRARGFEIRQQFQIVGVTFWFDIHIVGTSLLIEYQGDYWHANPAKYPAGTLLNIRKKGPTPVEAIWERDRRKRLAAEEHGFRVIAVWEADYVAHGAEAALCNIWIDDHPESIAKQHLLLAEQKDKASR